MKNRFFFYQYFFLTRQVNLRKTHVFFNGLRHKDTFYLREGIKIEYQNSEIHQSL